MPITINVVTEHKHPITEKLIRGLRIPVGKRIRRNDVYSSANGDWVPCHIGGKIPLDDTKVWIRPGAKLSDDAVRLLAYLQRRGFYLTRRNQHWIAVASLSGDGRKRATTTSLKPEAIEELYFFGFIDDCPGCKGFFQLTELALGLIFDFVAKDDSLPQEPIEESSAQAQQA